MGGLVPQEEQLGRPGKGFDLIARLIFTASNLKAVALTAALAVALVALATALGGSIFAARSALRPTGSDQAMGRFAAIASQLGIALPSTGATPVDFYARLVESSELLLRVAGDTVPISDSSPGYSHRRTFGEALEVRDTTAKDADARTVRSLRKIVRVSVDLPANLVYVDTRAADPSLARSLNEAVLRHLAEMSLAALQYQARAEREFTEARYQEAEKNLRAAENAMVTFLEKNRAYAGTPALAFEAARLQRQVDFRQQLFNALAQATETARIEEVRNTPQVNIVDPPSFAEDMTRWPLRLGLALLGGIGLGGVIVVLRDIRDRPDMWRV